MHLKALSLLPCIIDFLKAIILVRLIKLNFPGGPLIFIRSLYGVVLVNDHIVWITAKYGMLSPDKALPLVLGEGAVRGLGRLFSHGREV